MKLRNTLIYNNNFKFLNLELHVKLRREDGQQSFAIQALLLTNAWGDCDLGSGRDSLLV